MLGGRLLCRTLDWPEGQLEAAFFAASADGDAVDLFEQVRVQYCLGRPAAHDRPGVEQLGADGNRPPAAAHQQLALARLVLADPRP